MVEMDFYKKRLLMILISVIAMIVIVAIKSPAQDNSGDLVMFKKSENGSNTTKLPIFEFRAYSYEHKIVNITSNMVSEHPFGEIISKKFYLLDNSYKSEEAISPGNPQTKTLIKKPVIFDAVKQIDRNLKKSVKKGEMTIEEASFALNKVLDVALNVITADTKAFETALKAIKEINSKIELFTNRVILTY
jgi:hypothetical protein